jgi:hypothetical protein
MNKPVIPISITEVKNYFDLRNFIKVPFEIYKDDPMWVPPLKISMKEMLSPKHPFFKTSTIKCFLAKQGNKLVGRIAVGINHVSNDYHNEKSAFFGFFDCCDDNFVASTLLDQAKKYAIENSMTKLKGPFNLSTNYECGQLVDGFNDPPQIMMTYNPSYMTKFFNNCGMKKEMDLLAFELPANVPIPEKIVTVVERLKQANNISVRTVKLKNWDQEVLTILDIYNAAWEKNWGFVPMTSEEFLELAKSLKSILLEEMILIVEVANKPAGFILCLPDYNQILQSNRNGRLFPFGLYKLLTQKKSINRARIITMGIKSEYRHLGLSTLLYTTMQQQLFNLKQYQNVEMSWILEDNEAMLRHLKMMGASPYKTYRIYSETISEASKSS